MSKQKIIGIVAVLSLAFAFISLNQIPTGAIEWEDGWTVASPYLNSDEPYKGTASLTAAMTKTELTNQKSLLQTIAGVSITTQPQDQSVAWPAGATFTVELNNPEEKALHYQWFMSDGTNVYEIPQSNSTSITIPSTHFTQGPYWFCCKITDIDENVLFTDDAELDITGSIAIGENRPVLYIGEYAIERGETFNLADHNYGTGTIAMNENGTDILFNNVQMLNPDPVIDWSLAMTQGVLLMNTGYKVPDPEFYDETVYQDMPTEYHFHFTGDNHISSNFFDEVGAGNIFQTFFSDSDNPNKPTVYLEGDGTLTLEGGSYNYISDTNLSIGIDIDASSNENTYFGDAYGIQAINIDVEPDTTLSFDNNSGAIRAYSAGYTDGSLNVKDGAVISAHVTPGIGGNAYTGADFISAEDTVNIEGATLDFTGGIIPERFTPISQHKLHHFTGISGAEGVHINNSTYNLYIDAPTHPDGQFTANILGIKSGVASPSHDPTLLEITDSTVNISIEAPDSVIASGLEIGGNGEITDSNLLVTTTGLGRVSGIVASNALTITDSNVFTGVQGEPYVDTFYDETMDETFGILGNPVTINFTDDRHAIYASANRGAAIIGVDTDTPVDPAGTLPTYDENYTPTLLNLQNKATIFHPEDGVVSSFTYNHNYGHNYHLAETVYSPADTSEPALDVYIRSKDNNEPIPTPEDPEEDIVVPDTSTPTTPDTGSEATGIASTASASILPFCLIISLLITTSSLSIAYRHLHREK